MLPDIEAVTPRYADRRGGGIMTLTADFKAGAPLRMWLSYGSGMFPCHSGIPGHGTVLLPLGRTLTVVLPALPDDVPEQLAILLASDDDGSARSPAITIDAVAPFFDSQTYALRSVWAPVWATGPRELAAEAEPA